MASVCAPGETGLMVPPKPAPVSDLTFRPVTPETRRDFESFFASRGAPHFCWCMVWRRSSEEAREHTGPDRRRQMMKRLDAGTTIGVLAYDGAMPVGWVSIAPRDTHRNLGGPPAEPGEVIWSIVCFFVPRRLRGAGMVPRLIAAAVDHARDEGATVVEAYPVDDDAPSYRYMGFVETFKRAGFTNRGRVGVRRHVMRRVL